MRIRLLSIFCVTLAAGCLFAAASADEIDVDAPLVDDVPMPGDEVAADAAVPASQYCCGPCWTVAVDAIFLDRESDGRVLFEEFATGDAALSLPDFDFEPGVRASVIMHRPCHSDIEFTYFGVDQWQATGDVQGAPSQFAMNDLYGLSFADIDAAWVMYESDLDNFELNFRRCASDRLTLISGLRYISIDESLLIADTFLGGFPESFATQTSNDMIAIQFGADALVWNTCRAQVHVVTKGGVFYNDFQQSSAYDTDPAFIPDAQFTDGDNEACYMGELQITGTYCITPRLSVRGGYQLLYLSDVATAAEQIDSISLNTQPGGFVGGQVSTDEVLYHGGFVGIELVR